MPISMQRSLVPISSTSMPSTAAIASALSDRGGRLQHDDDQVRGVERGRHLVDLDGAVVVMRHAGEDAAVSLRRIAQPVGDLARLVGGVDMRHHDAERAVVEQPRGERILALGHPHDRRDAGVERRDRELRGGLDRHRAVLEIEKQPVEARRLHRLGDLDRAGGAHPEAERDLAARQPLARRC